MSEDWAYANHDGIIHKTQNAGDGELKAVDPQAITVGAAVQIYFALRGPA
jgi:hypothetical protein